ncbi:Stp1/IreP family PP2C-type Ser/Thr phosphatase [Anaerocolumna aminovalerica]|jgi:serine/threonine protein phosphatase PrpC|uniref:Protein phosphatase n=1 Tax=Anaerocolumna aminovalerica TaxID=1527 RepID=A0A1I5FD20_9FIRM|nr:Stp1/IreP family PP2C-type Ser/Thr phosphatase [Anaerocolumna aminovalerica]MBU5331811.1 Stp1/IreP family PP2C-type Ser/Thr phosphatase [Anaerocolumna aminovalerica]MDU6264042.1 Stp1/IreP family PP2C-type Ser/Thr phosphatase [Anaerocolumna aminovalerica]SFO21211.1 protein phosphatase [Anaerocolumna aminovalerica]
MRAFSITDIGEKRQINQDYVFCEENPVGGLPNLFIVADGMGGHKAGDYASRFCVEAFTENIKNSKQDTHIGMISEALQKTNDSLLKEAEDNNELEGMGTTFVAGTILKDVLYVTNIGDSRLYIINEDIKQITVDHSLVEEMVQTGEIDRKDMRFHPNKNIITRALGASKNVIPDYFEVNLETDDTILMCSDGLSNMVEDHEIMAIVKEYPDNLQLAAKELVKKANENGGKDNISIIIVKL